MARTHGVAATYIVGGCRCQPCTQANTAYNVDARARRAARLAADPTVVAHGRASTYRNWGCRCEPCSAANTAACRRSIVRRLVREAVQASG